MSKSLTSAQVFLTGQEEIETAFELLKVSTQVFPIVLLCAVLSKELRPQMNKRVFCSLHSAKWLYRVPVPKTPVVGVIGFSAKMPTASGLTLSHSW